MERVTSAQRALVVVGVVVCALMTVAGCSRRPGAQTAGGTTEQAPAPVELEPRTVPVFCYHAMSAGARGTYDVPTEDFKEQLAAIAEAGYQTVTPAQIADYLAGTGKLPEKAVCITFDDGPRSILTVSKPLMDAHGFVGAVFLITDSVGGAGKLSWDDVRELEAAGWEIGSHTASHIYATRVSGEVYAKEAAASKAAIEEHIKGKCVAIAYPYGLYDEETLTLTRDAGYRIGFAIDRGPMDQTDDPYLLPRQMVVNGNSMRTFRRWLSQEKLHVEHTNPPRGHRFDTHAVAITGVITDPGVDVKQVEFTLDGKPLQAALGTEPGSFTLHVELSTGANIIRANYWGNPQRETSWVVVCDAQ